MKIFITLLLVLSFFSPETQRTKAPTYYLNKKEVSFNSFKYIKPSNIDSMRVDKTTENGALYVYTNENIRLLTLNDVVEKYTDLKKIDNTVLFQINGDVVCDTLDIKIDASWFIYVKVNDLANVNYLDQALDKLKIVNIDLEKEKRKADIRIR